MERRNTITLAGAGILLVLAALMLWRQVGSDATNLPADDGSQPGAWGSVSVADSASEAAGAEPFSPTASPPITGDDQATRAPSDDTAAAAQAGRAGQASQAAQKAVESVGRVASLGRLRRREVVRELITGTFFPTFMDETNRSLTELDEHRSDGVSVEEWALRIMVQEKTDGEFDVQVWTVSVITIGDKVRSAWRTVHLDMRQVDGIWLVDGWSSVDGPSPAPPASAVFATGSDMSAVAEWARADG